jgi:hypothetical protein
MNHLEKDRDFLLNSLKPNSAPISKRSFTHPEYDSTYKEQQNQVQDWVLLRSLHREKQQAKLHHQKLKREAVSLLKLSITL